MNHQVEARELIESNPAPAPPPVPVPKPKPRRLRRRDRWRGNRMMRRFIDQILAGELTTYQIADVLTLAADELGKLAEREAAVRPLRGFSRLGDMRAQLAASDYRAAVINRLASIALSETSQKEDDIARKACTDFLRLKFDAFAHLSEQPTEQEAHESDALVIELLKELSEVRK